MSFHEIRFPEDISFGSSGGPEFSTSIIATQSGYEQRNINWSAARARYNIVQAVKTQNQLDELITFFRARQGRAHGFRFKDWADFSVSGGKIGVGDDVEVKFQLSKTYKSGEVETTREVNKPVEGSVKIYLDSVEQATGFSIDHTNGEITFDTAPANALEITADFEFDVPVRFDTDIISSQFDSYNVNSVNDISLIEVRV